MSDAVSTATQIAEGIGGIGGILALGYTIRRGARDDANKAAKDRADYGKDKFDEGFHSRDDELRQMRSERDDARYERDSIKAERDMWQQRYLDCAAGKGNE